jgi:hypothetical protein
VSHHKGLNIRRQGLPIGHRDAREFSRNESFSGSASALASARRMEARKTSKSIGPKCVNDSGDPASADILAASISA